MDAPESILLAQLQQRTRYITEWQERLAKEKTFLREAMLALRLGDRAEPVLYTLQSRIPDLVEPDLERMVP